MTLPRFTFKAAKMTKTGNDLSMSNILICVLEDSVFTFHKFFSKITKTASLNLSL